AQDIDVVPIGAGDQQVHPAVAVHVAEPDRVVAQLLVLDGTGVVEEPRAGPSGVDPYPTTERCGGAARVEADDDVVASVVVDIAGGAATPGAVSRFHATEEAQQPSTVAREDVGLAEWQ